MPVASGLSAGAGLFARAEVLAGDGLVPEPPLIAGELDGVFCAGVVPEAVDDGVPEGVPVGDGLPDDEGVPVGDELPDGDELGEPGAVGEQDAVGDPPGPLLRWPDGVVPPPLVPV